MTKEEYEKERAALGSKLWGELILLRSHTPINMRNSAAYVSEKYRHYRNYFAKLETLEDEYKATSEH